MFGPIKIDRFSSKRTGLKFSGKGSEFCFLVQTQKLFLAKSKIRVTRLDLSLLLPAQWLKILILKLKKLIESNCFIIIFEIQMPMNKKQYYLVFIEVDRMTTWKSSVILMAFFKVSH